MKVPLRPGRLVSLGSILLDLVLQIPALPPRGGDVLARQAGMTVGGAYNVLSAAARLGLPAAYAGSHGEGPFGDRVRAALQAEGVEVLRPAAPGEDTGYTVALVDSEGERTFVTATGADARVAPADLAGLRYRSDDAIYISGYDLAYPESGPALAAHIGALPAGPLVAVDPGPLAADIPSERWEAVLVRTDLLSLNAREAELLGGSARLQSRLHPAGVLILRDGPRGATLHVAGEPAILVKSPVVKAVDSSGAGDVHVGATLAGLAQGLAWVAAVELANRAAAYSVTQSGPANGPTLRQLREFDGPAVSMS